MAAQFSDLYLRVLGMFVEQNKSSELLQALVHGEYTLARTVAHAIKGSAATIGSHRLGMIPWPSITATQLDPFDATDLGSLPPAALGALTPAALASLDAAQFANLTPTQLAQIKTKKIG